MKFLNTQIAPPEFDVGMAVVASVLFLFFSIVMLLDGQPKLGVVCLTFAVSAAINAWRAWKYLPERRPFRFSLRELMIAVTVAAVLMGIMRVLD